MVKQEILTDQQKAILVAVKWWSNKLRGINAEGIPGDRESDASLFALYANIIIQKNDNMTENKIEKFERLLITHLTGEAKKGCRRTTLSTDYGPDWPLSKICSDSEVSGAQFPMKTSMYIDFVNNVVNYSIVRGASGEIYPVK